MDEQNGPVHYWIQVHALSLNAQENMLNKVKFPLLNILLPMWNKFKQVLLVATSLSVFFFIYHHLHEI